MQGCCAGVLCGIWGCCAGSCAWPGLSMGSRCNGQPRFHHASVSFCVHRRRLRAKWAAALIRKSVNTGAFPVMICNITW